MEVDDVASGYDVRTRSSAARVPHDQATFDDPLRRRTACDDSRQRVDGLSGSRTVAQAERSMATHPFRPKLAEPHTRSPVADRYRGLRR